MLQYILDLFKTNARQTIERIQAGAQLRATDRVLDVGGGDGRVARKLKNLVSTVIVVDPDKKKIERCRKRLLECREGVAEHLPFENESFDLVIMVSAFHHVPNQSAAAEEMKRVLRPGGPYRY